jgi:hypothetical protein
VQEFIISKRGTKEVAFSFQIQQRYAKLKLDVDISFLDNPIMHLSMNSMDLLRLWFSHFHMNF